MPKIVQHDWAEMVRNTTTARELAKAEAAEEAERRRRARSRGVVLPPERPEARPPSNVLEV